MQRPAGSRLDLTLAREVAVREGIKAVLDGDISAVGPSYILQVRLVSADSGVELAAFRETANDAAGVIPAVDRLSRKLRGRIGESLKTVRSSVPLEQVTTGSLEALRKYAQAERAFNSDGDGQRATALLQEAIALDTSFAMAYRKLGVVLGNIGAPPDQRVAALTKAYEHRDRLTEGERYLTEGTYWMSIPARDPVKSLAAYNALIDIEPENTSALNNASLIYMEQGNYAKAAVLLGRAIQVDSMVSVAYSNLAESQFELGHSADAKATLVAMSRRFPNNPDVAGNRLKMELAEGNYDSAGATIKTIRANMRDNLDVQSGAENMLEVVSRAKGQLADAGTHAAAEAGYDAKRGFAASALGYEMQLAFYDSWYREQPAKAVRRLDAALGKHPLSSIPKLERPYETLSLIYAISGRPDRARAMLAEQEREMPAAVIAAQQYQRHNALAEIALAEGKPECRDHGVPAERPRRLRNVPVARRRAGIRPGRPCRLGDRDVREIPRHAEHGARESRPDLPRRHLQAPRRSLRGPRRYGARGLELFALHGRVEGRRPRPPSEGRGSAAPHESARARRGQLERSDRVRDAPQSPLVR